MLETFRSLLPAFLPAFTADVAVACIQAFLILNLIAVGALVFIWGERKVSARIQDRLGPTRVGGLFGWLQSLADGVKLITKEDILPDEADAFLFRLAPYVSFCAGFAAYIALPFSDGWVAQDLDSAVFLLLAVLGLEVFGVILAGYASASKWSLFGAMREAAQVVSYEVPLGLCVVPSVVLAGTMNLTEIARQQTGGFWNWYMFHDPFTFIAFWVFFTCAIASVNRAPFDLAEAESELVAGFHTEYSGLRWSFFFMAEYGSMFLVSGLAAVLFCGGWSGPLPIAEWAGLVGDGWQGTVGRFIGLINFLLKCSFGMIVMMWVRWSLPRLRIDQVMHMCLKYCLPISCFTLVGVSFWQLLLPAGLLGLAPGLTRPAAEHRFPNAIAQPAAAAPATPDATGSTTPGTARRDLPQATALVLEGRAT